MAFTEPNEPDEDDKLRRIKIICPELHKEIIEMESKIYIEMNDRMADIAIVKDLALQYNVKEAKRLFSNLVKEGKKPRR